MSERARTYRSSDDRRDQLLDLGVRLFASRSYEEVAIDDIAREAGVSKGLLYHYFGSKRTFYTEVVRRTAAELLLAVDPDPAASATENIRRGLTHYFKFVSDRADAYLALMHGGLGVDDIIHGILEDIRNQVVSTILTQIQGEEEPLARVAARAWIGNVEAAALDWLKHRDVELDALIEMLSVALYTQLAVAARRSRHGRLRLDIADGWNLLKGLIRFQDLRMPGRFRKPAL
jgi:AcrR family transcriptional regulator